MPSDYSGHDRRAKSEDHDVIIKMEEMLENHIKNYEFSQIKFNDHIKDDNENFKEITKALGRIDKVMYVGMGIIIAVEVLPKLPEILHFFNK